MSIGESDLYHGAVLALIVKYSNAKFTKKNEYGHYWLYTKNGVRRFLVKHTKGSRNTWRFTLTSENLNVLQENINESDNEASIKSFLILVCHREAICILTKNQIRKSVNLLSASQQWIRIAIPSKGSGMRVSGSKNQLQKIVKRNSFPSVLFS